MVLSGLSPEVQESLIYKNDEQNYTPIMIATEFNSLSSLGFLLDKSASLAKSRNDNGEQANESVGKSLLIATTIGNDKAIKILLSSFETKKGVASPFDQKSGKNTLLHMAMIDRPSGTIKTNSAKKKIIESILRKVSNKDIFERRNNGGLTASEFARSEGLHEIAHIIDNKHQSIPTKDNNIEKKDNERTKKSEARKRNRKNRRNRKDSAEPVTNQETKIKTQDNITEEIIPNNLIELNDLLTDSKYDDLSKEEYLPKVKKAIKNIEELPNFSPENFASNLEYKSSDGDKTLKEKFIEKIYADKRFSSDKSEVSNSAKKDILWKISPELKAKKDTNNTLEPFIDETDFTDVLSSLSSSRDSCESKEEENNTKINNDVDSFYSETEGSISEKSDATTDQSTQISDLAKILFDLTGGQTNNNLPNNPNNNQQQPLKNQSSPNQLNSTPLDEVELLKLELEATKRERYSAFQEVEYYREMVNGRNLLLGILSQEQNMTEESANRWQENAVVLSSALEEERDYYQKIIANISSRNPSKVEL